MLVFFILSFIPAKYSADFKKEIKGIDKLTIFNPTVHIFANNTKIEYLDSNLTKANQELFEGLTNNLLFKKFTLEESTLPVLDINIFDDLFKELEDSPKLLDNISAKRLLSEVKLECKTKFALMLVYYGRFNPNFQPHYNTQSGVASNKIIINPSTKPYSEMRLLVIDTENEEIVFYDSVNSTNFDPRVSSEVEQMAKKILKKIYYK